MTNRKDITREYVLSRLNYDRDTGVFSWKLQPDQKIRHHRYLGKKAGSMTKPGYWVIGLKGRLCMAHQLVWLVEMGRWPENEIDHINTEKLDCRISNLRLATHAQNGKNTRGWKRKSLPKGVFVRCDKKAYYSCLMVDGRRIYLGSFATVNEARVAYAAAAKEHHGEFARTE